MLPPLASTSRIPYISPSSPFSTSRTFSSTPPAQSRRTAHLIHPLLRQRLTNLSFALAGLLSVATVSLTMSGSLGEAPCPARSRAGAAMQAERDEFEARAAAARGVDGTWWKTKGRFLEDPLPISAAVRPTAPLPAQSAAAQTPRAEREIRGQDEEERIARPPPSKREQSHEAGTGWRSWSGTSERVV
ncbi:hypothetical protein JCM11641_002401 [Rhodosporidiobolus odoratus]